jgi:hypothetical protein
VKVYTYDPSQVVAQKCPFQNDFATDGWVAYHGTCSIAEASIERNGFAWKDDTYSLADIEAVANVFRQLSWEGESGDGFAVLASFSTSDFRHLPGSNRKPIFFSATSKRSLLYASREWAGGETARALRLAFRDLHDFLTSHVFRREMLWQAWQQAAGSIDRDELPEDCRPDSVEAITFDHYYRLLLYCLRRNPNSGPLFVRGTAPVKFTEQWLADQLIELQPLRERSNEPEKRYEYGIIYAVKFHESDLPYLKKNNKDLISLASISSDRIVAKALIDSDTMQLVMEDGLNHRDTDEYISVLEHDGVFPRASEARSSAADAVVRR